MTQPFPSSSRRRLVAALAAIAGAVGLALAGPASALQTGLVAPDVPGPNTGRVIGELADTHAGWLRLFASWPALEPYPGVYNLGQYDATIQAAHATGVKVLLDVTSSPSWETGSSNPATPPRNPADYAAFLSVLAAHYRALGAQAGYGSSVEAYEIWNEEDGGVFWAGGPDPAAYTRLLRGAYGAVKRADPNATVVMGGTAGNDFDFVNRVYHDGAKGSFDAIGVHTDTACNLLSPRQGYRDLQGHIGFTTFTGYREVRRVELANGDTVPIWMTEMGWSTDPGTCGSGSGAGRKAGGVSEATQAQYLSEGYHCLTLDRYVTVGLWFAADDSSAGGSASLFGLERAGGSRKPAYAAFRAFNTSGDALSGACYQQLDTGAPIVRVVSPRPDAAYVKDLKVSVTAVDPGGVGITRTIVFVDGHRVHTHQGPAQTFNFVGARYLPLGQHVIVIRAENPAKRAGTARIVVRHVRRVYCLHGKHTRGGRCPAGFTGRAF